MAGVVAGPVIYLIAKKKAYQELETRKPLEPHPSSLILPVSQLGDRVVVVAAARAVYFFVSKYSV